MLMARVAAGCAVLILISGCSVLFKGSGKYASLPRRPVAGTLLFLNMGPKATPRRLAAPPSREQGASVDPFAALKRSQAARLGWEKFRPGDLSESTLRAHEEEGGTVNFTPLKPYVVPEYDRATVARRLEQEGRDAAKSICAGC
jgi:hypothetical protein